MKKTALLLVLAIALSLAMTSCQIVQGLINDVKLTVKEPESALEVWENIDTRMESLKSYEAPRVRVLAFLFWGGGAHGFAWHECHRRPPEGVCVAPRRNCQGIA